MQIPVNPPKVAKSLRAAGSQGSEQPHDRLMPSHDSPPLYKASDFAATCHRNENWLSGAKRTRAEHLTSYFENSTLKPQYAYIENIKDGRGYTAGRAGFTTRTGDFLIAVQDYSQARPGNVLEKYLPRLSELAASDSSSTSGLKGIVSHWKTSCRDKVFLNAQDGVVDRLYFTPAMESADRLGLKLPLSRAVLYDTIIQHGNGEDHDALPAICRRTQEACSGTPATGIEETRWLASFLADRRDVLMNAQDPATQQAWRESVSRVDAFSQIAGAQNYALDGPIQVNLPSEDLVFQVP